MAQRTPEELEVKIRALEEHKAKLVNECRRIDEEIDALENEFPPVPHTHPPGYPFRGRECPWCW